MAPTPPPGGVIIESLPSPQPDGDADDDEAPGRSPARSRLPWRPRQPPKKPQACHQLRDPALWPSEPPSPVALDPQRFRDALATVCTQAATDVPADDVRAAAEATGLDPFVLGALVFERSRCNARYDRRGGLGLMALDARLYRAAGAPRPPGEAAEWTRKALLDPARNVALGAKVLRYWEDNHEALDVTFRSLPHRHAVSHLYWGDRVLSAGQEDLVLTTRRRLLARYGDVQDVPHETPVGVAMTCPLEGLPRVATSGPGDDRDGGARRHRGLDIVASEGEPVHAVADGTVIFAGANLRGAPRRGGIPPSRIRRYAYRRMGAGGIYLCIQHDPAASAPAGPLAAPDSALAGPVAPTAALPATVTTQDEVVTCYMHLASYSVAQHDRVTAGQIIGTVGRTGVRLSPAHLHFEVRVNQRFKNPQRMFAEERVIPPGATMTHLYNVAARRTRLRRARAAARAARAAAVKTVSVAGS